MNKIIAVFLLLSGIVVKAQIKCEYEIEEKTDSTFLKKTNDYLVYEKDFVKTSEYLTFSLIDSDGVLYLQAQLLQKSNDFITAKCLDATSKIYLQLTNGKIYTLLNAEESCSQLIYSDAEKSNIRILNGYFLFSKDNFEELKKVPISLVRIKYASETVDYVMKKELKSANFPGTFLPENYFVNYLQCIF